MSLNPALFRRRRRPVGGGGPTLVFEDTFTAANSTPLHGRAADTGQLWTDLSETYDIQDNELNSATSDRASVDIGISDYSDLSCDLLSNLAAQQWMLFRFVDADNSLWWGFPGASLVPTGYRQVANGFTEIAAGAPVANRDVTRRMKVVADGSDLSYYVDEVLSDTASESTFETSTKIGVYSDRVDNMRATS